MLHGIQTQMAAYHAKDSEYALVTHDLVQV